MKKLSELLIGINYKERINYRNIDIDCLMHNSKDCEKNCLYFCLSGTKVDGHEYAIEAVQKGAVAIVTERRLDIDCIQIVVENSRIAMAQISKMFYDNACDKLKIISVVGTNGKTTISTVLSKLLRFCGKKVGVIGTNGVFLDEDLSLPCDLTTPDPIELHYIFNQLVSFGIDYVVMEVSAQAIYFNKVYGIKSILGIFTNITNEHLDFFENMEKYSQVKMSFFDKLYIDNAIINIDDEYGKSIVEKCNVNFQTYGIFNPADTFALDIKTSMRGSSFIVNSCDSILNIITCLVGDFNVYNLLAVINSAIFLGCTPNDIINGIKVIKGVDGRFNVFEMDNNIKVVVDFAHTPDGFEKTLGLIKKLRTGRIITLFGCVEYSDKNKRKLIGQVADRYSDRMYLTADNPNNSSVIEISKDIADGIKTCEYEIIVDRKNAIRTAFKNLIKNDTLVLLGKGNENFQKINGVNQYYNDIDEVKKYLK